MNKLTYSAILLLLIFSSMTSSCFQPQEKLEWHEENGFRWAEVSPPMSGRTGFEALPPSKTGIDFSNSLTIEQLTQNRHLLNGSGVAAGDVDGDGFSDFIYTGMSDELVAKIGPLPRLHGLLAAMLGDTAPFRTADIRRDPRFRWWPDAHPRSAVIDGF